MQINTNYQNRFLSSSASGAAEISAKKTVNKISENIRINRADDDSARLSISEEHLAKKHFFEVLMALDEGITIVSTVLFNISSVKDIFNTLRKGTVTDSLSLVNEINRIRINSEFNSEKLLDGSFYKLINLWHKDSSAIEIDFRNSLRSGNGETSIDFDILNADEDGNLVSGISKPLVEVINDNDLNDFSVIDSNINRMEEHALALKEKILNYHKELETIITKLSQNSNFSDARLVLFLGNIRKELSEKSAHSMLTQISENHANAVALLP